MYNYADGVGDDGPVLKKFTEILQRYKKNFYHWEYFDAESENSISYNSAAETKKEFVCKIIAAVVIAFLSVILIMFVKPEWYFMLLFFIISGIVLGKLADSAAWGIIMIVVICPFSLIFNIALRANTLSVTLSMFLIITYLLVYSAVSLYSFASTAKYLDKKNNTSSKKAENMKIISKELDDDRVKLFKLLPDLKAEFRNILNEKLSLFQGCFTNEEISALDITLPDLWWWMLSQDDLRSIERDFDIVGLRWKTKWFQRDADTAYQDADENYSPMYSKPDNIKLKAAEKGEVYFIDFISKNVQKNIATRTVTFEQDKYDHFDLDRKEFKLDNAMSTLRTEHARGTISDVDYGSLSLAAYNCYSNISKMRKEKVTETSEEKYEMRTHTNIWSGQMLLIGEDSDDFAIFDYRSDGRFLFKNLDSLEGINITRVYGSIKDRNPIFLAKIHKVCPNCR